jgi:hypothetical protein
VDWIEEGMVGSTLRRTRPSGSLGDGYEFEIRNQFFHGDHPLGWIRLLAVSLDSVLIESTNTFLIVRGQTIAAWQVPQIIDIWWHACETASVFIKVPGRLNPGAHDIVCTIDFGSFFTPLVDVLNLRPTSRCELRARLDLAEAQ